MKSFLKILLLILTAFFQNISDGFSIISLIEKSEEQKVSVSCNNTFDIPEKDYNNIKNNLKILSENMRWI